MIIYVKKVTICCAKCQSTDLVKNGKNSSGNQTYHCKNCDYYGTVNAKPRGRNTYSRRRKLEIIAAYFERMSMHGLERVFKICRQTLARWLKELDKTCPDDLGVGDAIPEETDIILEGDEMWSFVLKKVNKKWIWILQERETRLIIAFVVGDRSEKTAQKLWQAIPDKYKRHSFTYTDLWEAYQQAFPKEHHQACDKTEGQTAHVERVNNTFRQRLGRLTRKSLAFSKSVEMHKIVIKLFICIYNLEKRGIDDPLSVIM